VGDDLAVGLEELRDLLLPVGEQAAARAGGLEQPHVRGVADRGVRMDVECDLGRRDGVEHFDAELLLAQMFCDRLTKFSRNTNGETLW
jgi:hypothetical protein